MTRIILRFVFVLVMAVMAVSVAVAKERTPAGSFVNYRATTVQELIDQVNSDAKAKARFVKHFGVSEQQLIESFSNLELVSLKSALKVETWYVSTNGSTHKKTKLLPKGTLVFATKEGKPVLQWSCGNPLSVSLPKPMVKQVSQPTTQVTGTTPDTQVLADPIEVVSAAAITVPPGLVVTAAAPVAAIPAMEAVALPSVAAVPAISAGSGFGLGWLGGAAGLAGLLAFGGGGGDNPPVPEPATLIALSCGLVSFAAAYRKRR